MSSWFGDLRGRALWVVFGCLVCQMGLGFGYSFGAVAPDLIADLGWTRALFSSARAPQLWVIALASPLVGVLTVRFGGRAVLLVSVVILGVSFLVLGTIQSWWHLTTLTVVIGLGLTGVGDIAAGAVVSQWVTRARGLALGLVYTGSNLGGTAATAIVDRVLQHGTWRDGFQAIGLAGLVVMLPIAFLTVRDRVGAVATGAVGNEREPEPEPEEAAQAVEGSARDLDVRAALRTRSFWILWVTLFAFWFYFLAMLDHLVLFLTDAGVDDARSHFRNAIFLGFFSKIGFGFIADRLHAKAALALDFGLLAISSVLLLLLPNPGLLPVFIVAYGFSAAARDVVTPLIVIHCFGARYLAQIYGALMLTLLPGGTLGPIFAGGVHDATGSYAMAFASFAILNAVSFGLLLLVRDERREVA